MRYEEIIEEVRNGAKLNISFEERRVRINGKEMGMHQIILVTLDLVGVTLSMKVGEQVQKRNDEDCIEAPTQNPRAARPSQVVEDKHSHDQKACPELQKLKIGHQFLPFRALPDGAHQVVGVHNNMHYAVGN